MYYTGTFINCQGMGKFPISMVTVIHESLFYFSELTVPMLNLRKFRQTPPRFRRKSRQNYFDMEFRYFIGEALKSFIQEMTRKQVRCTPVQNLSWGLLMQLTIPGGSQIGVFQSQHARPVDGSFRIKAFNKI